MMNKWSYDVRIELIKMGGGGDGLSKYLPVAVMYGVDGDFVIGAGTEMTVGFAVILRGPDAGKVVGFLDGAPGPAAGGADASAALEGMYIFYSGDANNFSAELLKGYRTEFSGSFSAIIDLGITGFIGRNINPIDGGRVYGIGGSFGVGWPVFNRILNGNINKGTTTIYGN